MPLASSFLFLSFIRNDVSYVLIDQYFPDLECTTRRFSIRPDCQQTSIGIVNTDRPVRPTLAIGCPLPTKDLGCRHRSTVSHTVGSLSIHHCDPQSLQYMIERQQIVSQQTEGMTGDNLIDRQRMINRQGTHSPSLQRQHMAADSQRFSDVGTERSHISPFGADDA